jgi:transposase
MFQLPPSMQEWVPKGHVSRFVSDLVDSMDLTAIEDAYDEERGYPPYDQRMMVKVLLHGYCTGIYSSGNLAARIVDHVPMRFLAAGNEPDFRTISDFRKRHEKALSGLFDQVLQIAAEAGLVSLGRVAMDGTKIKANASKHKAMSCARMKQRDKELRDQIRYRLEQAAATDKVEEARDGKDRRVDEMPAELEQAESRQQKIREAKAALEGKDPDDAVPPDKSQRNFTDPDSSIQKTPDGFIQGYNAQVAVDGEFQKIVSQHVTAHGPDVQELKAAVERVEKVPGCGPETFLADAGYSSAANIEALESKGIEPYIATGRMKHSMPAPPVPRGRIPQGLTPREQMARKLRTKKGQRLYAKRKAIVEPVFGQIKQARGFRQFLRRGLGRVGHEWALITEAHNILKLHRAMSMI